MYFAQAIAYSPLTLQVILGCSWCSIMYHTCYENGYIIRVGAPTASPYDVTRFGARARVFESCKGCVAA